MSAEPADRTAARSRRRRRALQPLLALVSIVIVAAVPYVGCPRLQLWTARADAEEALGELHACLLGPHGTTSEHLRTAALTASLGPRRNGDWPARCGSAALALELAVGAMQAAEATLWPRPAEREREPEGQLAELRQSLATLRPPLAEGHIAAEPAARLFELAELLRLRPQRPATPQPRPTDVQLSAARAMTPLFRDAHTMLTDPPNDADLQLLFHGPGRRHGLCTLDLPSGATARCRDLPPSVPSGRAGQLLAGDPRAPERLLASRPTSRPDDWVHAAYDPETGERLLELAGQPAGGYVWRDGTMVVAAWTPERRAVVLHRLRDGLAQPPHSVRLPDDPSGGPQVLADELLWTVGAQEDTHRLYARRARADADPLDAVVEVGSTGRMRAPLMLEACGADHTLVVLIRGLAEGYQVPVALAFRMPDGWHAPQHQRVDSDGFGLTCRPGSGSLSWIESADERPLSVAGAAASPVRGVYHVHRVRCTPAGCVHERAQVTLARYSRSSRYVVGDLGDLMMVLWRSPLGDVRMLRAPIGELEAAQPVVVFDDAPHGGFAWELERGATFVRGQVGLLLAKARVRDQWAVFGFRIDRGGQVQPIVATHEATVGD